MRKPKVARRCRAPSRSTSNCMHPPRPPIADPPRLATPRSHLAAGSHSVDAMRAGRHRSIRGRREREREHVAQR